MATKASEAARAVNVFLEFSSNDQEALLEVIQDYFSSPAGPEENDDDLLDDDEQASLEGNNTEFRIAALTTHKA